MNCAILKIYVDQQDKKTVYIKLIYNGSIDINEDRDINKYYNVDSFNELNLNTTKLIIPYNINIYLIRHAQGYHNLNNTFLRQIKSIFTTSSLKDPQLTSVGVEQSNIAGNFLVKENINNNNTLFCCSHMLRTRETISLILNQMKLNNNVIHILPSAHEISDLYNENNKKKGYCYKDIDKKVYKCDYISSANGVHGFNWEYFDKVHDDNLNILNMIYESILMYMYINNIDDESFINFRNKLFRI